MNPELIRVLSEVRYSVPERMMMSDELKKVIKALSEVRALLDMDDPADVDTKRIFELWASINIPMSYVSNIFDARMHEALHKVNNDQCGGH